MHSKRYLKNKILSELAHTDPLRIANIDKKIVKRVQDLELITEEEATAAIANSIIRQAHDNYETLVKRQKAYNHHTKTFAELQEKEEKIYERIVKGEKKQRLQKKLQHIERKIDNTWEQIQKTKNVTKEPDHYHLPEILVYGIQSEAITKQQAEKLGLEQDKSLEDFCKSYGKERLVEEYYNQLLNGKEQVYKK